MAYDQSPDAFDPAYVLPNELYVGLHRWAEQLWGPPVSRSTRDSCPLQLAWDLCRNYAWGDIHFDEQLYIVKIRIHREGRGGKPFTTSIPLSRITPRWAMNGLAPWAPEPAIELGMPEADLVRTRPDYVGIRFARDPEFGPLKIYSYEHFDPYDHFEVEIDLEASPIVGAFVLL